MGEYKANTGGPRVHTSVGPQPSSAARSWAAPSARTLRRRLRSERQNEWQATAAADEGAKLQYIVVPVYIQVEVPVYVPVIDGWTNTSWVEQGADEDAESTARRHVGLSGAAGPEPCSLEAGAVPIGEQDNQEDCGCPVEGSLASAQRGSISQVKTSCAVPDSWDDELYTHALTRDGQ